MIIYWDKKTNSKNSTAGRMERSREEFETNTKEAATTSGKNPRA